VVSRFRDKNISHVPERLPTVMKFLAGIGEEHIIEYSDIHSHLR
jgi:hypothetical protein